MENTEEMELVDYSADPLEDFNIFGNPKLLPAYTVSRPAVQQENLVVSLQESPSSLALEAPPLSPGTDLLLSSYLPNDFANNIPSPPHSIEPSAPLITWAEVNPSITTIDSIPVVDSAGVRADQHKPVAHASIPSEADHTSLPRDSR